MDPKTILTIVILLAAPVLLKAQSSTTEALGKKHGGALELFFYNNTLRMLNQTDDKEFDEIIKDIEKMRFLMIKKAETNFGDDDLKKLVTDYKSESFQEIMTSRHEGKTFNVYMKDKNGKTSGMLVLINDIENLYVLDILGRIALEKVTKLYSKLDENTDISSKIKAFAGQSDKNDENKEQDH